MKIIGRLMTWLMLIGFTFLSGELLAWGGTDPSLTVIGSSTWSAVSGESVFMTGQNLDHGNVFVSDGSQTLQARILTRDAGKLSAVIPDGLARGTLWVWLNNAGVLSNKIILNNPQPWWIQPDRLDIGATTRIFGRNFDAGQNPGAKVVVVLDDTTTRRYYDGIVTGSNEITLTLSPRDKNHLDLARGTYNVYLKEPKTEDLYGPVAMTIEAPYQIPSYTVDVTQFGAIPDDDKADNSAFIQAFNDVAAHGGGTVTVPAGVFRLDETYGYSAASSILPTGSNRNGSFNIKGAGRDKTVLEFKSDTGFNRGAFAGITLYDHSSLKDVTLRAAASAFIADNALVRIRGNHVEISNVVFNTDLSPIRVTPIISSGDYVLLNNLEIFSSERISTDANRQVWIKNVLHHGAREMEFYDFSAPGIDLSNVLGVLFLAKGTQEMILENCTGKSRWKENQGHFKRFFVGWQSNRDLRHLYIANNRVIDQVSQPWSNSSECILFEGGVGYYSGRATMAGPTTVSLLDGGVTDSVVLRDRLIDPVTVFVKTGTGQGQMRHGTVSADGASVLLDQPFLIDLDGTSVVSVTYAFLENIIEKNNLQTLSLYPEANNAIQFYGVTMGNIVNNNTIIGFRDGFQDWAYRTDQQVNFFNEIVGNEIIGAIRGLTTIVYKVPYSSQVLGNVYRRNYIHDMDLDSPFWKRKERYEGMGIFLYPDVVNPPKDVVIGQIYEGNVLRGIRNAMGTDPVAQGLVVRNNIFTGVHDGGIDLSASLNLIQENNTVEMLPQVQVTASSAVYKKDFKSAIAATGYDHYLHVSRDYYVWSAGSSGTISLSATDPGSGSAPGLTLNSVPGITLNNNTITWTNLAAGYYPLVVSGTGRFGVALQRLHLMVGAYENFEIISSSTSLEPGVLLKTPQASYASQVTNAYASNGVDPFCNGIDLITKDGLYPGSTQAIKLIAFNQEVSFTNTSIDAVRAPDAVLSFVKNAYSSIAGSTLKIRLRLDDQNYYEFKDYLTYEPYFKIRTLVKVVGGVETMRVVKVASHKTESPVIFEKRGSLVRFSGWGDSIKFVDPAPMLVKDWELRLAAFPKSDAWAMRYASWISLDNLYFSKSQSSVPGVYFGDVDGDLVVTPRDTLLAAKEAVGSSSSLTSQQAYKADVAGNGTVSLYDAALIAQRAAGSKAAFPVEK
ncbi:MAG: hypothetical protein HQL22_00115 [Candidatus Omnitrophica bacterium]|nr:hypothetical protein [Candidatus Omnitrophota bacterium]